MNGSVMKAENPFLCRSFPCLDFVDADIELLRRHRHGEIKVAG
jgi:hypothetical protein